MNDVLLLFAVMLGIVFLAWLIFEEPNPVLRSPIFKFVARKSFEILVGISMILGFALFLIIEFFGGGPESVPDWFHNSLSRYAEWVERTHEKLT